MTNIPYADETWSAVTGCSKVSPGCANCWAERISHRFDQTRLPWTPEHAAENIKVHPSKLEEPLHWRKPRTVFVCPMSDLFHPDVPDEFIDQVFAVVGHAKQHRFLLLTKRAERMKWHCDSLAGSANIHRDRVLARYGFDAGLQFEQVLCGSRPYPLPNVWLGVSVENQHWADERIPLLLDTPAAHRWVSAEPLLGAVDLRRFIGGPACNCICGCPCTFGNLEASGLCSVCQISTWRDDDGRHAEMGSVDWVVLGGESGPGHRPMKLAWADRISEQCYTAKVPYYGKQIAEVRPDQPLPGALGRREVPW